MVLHESLKRSGVWGQNSNSIVRHMKKDLDIISTYSHFTIHPCTLATRNSCLQFPEDAVPISCPHNLWCLASPLLRKSSTKTNMKDWFLCDVFLHSLRKWLLPLPYAFLFQTPTQISLAYVYNILQLTVCMFERSGFSLVQFSHPVMSDSLQPHGLQHTSPLCPSLTHGAYSNSCPLSRWGHPTISSCHPLLLPPSTFPSIRVFSNESVLCIRWPKYWSFSFIISPSNEHSGLICFRMDWLDLLAIQGTLKSLLQHHSSKASILRCSAFFIVQLSHIYVTTGQTIALTRWNIVDKVMSLLLNMLSRLVIIFLQGAGVF